MISTIRFCVILALEIVFYPILYFLNYLKFIFGYRLIPPKKNYLIRKPAALDYLLVCIHDWAGYPPKRIKRLKNGVEFECGLYYQLKRYNGYTGNHQLSIVTTIADGDKKNLDFFHSTSVNCINVTNKGMDFSGYSSFLEMVHNDINSYVILNNSSVNMKQTDFIDDYIIFMEKHPEVGLLGVSYSTKMSQTFIGNNFKPHLQSFFLLSTIDVLNKVVKKNGGFPGVGITNKRLLVRLGEIKLTKIVLNLGYKAACILSSGKPYFFDRYTYFDNGRYTWSIEHGDYRLFQKDPSSINQITK